MERAKYLAEGLMAVESTFADTRDSGNANPLLQFYRPELDEVIRLDSNNSAGVRDHFSEILKREKERKERIAFDQKLNEIFNHEGVAAALQVLDQKIDDVGPSDFQKQLRRTRLDTLERKAF